MQRLAALSRSFSVKGREQGVHKHGVFLFNRGSAFLFNSGAEEGVSGQGTREGTWQREERAESAV